MVQLNSEWKAHYSLGATLFAGILLMIGIVIGGLILFLFSVLVPEFTRENGNIIMIMLMSCIIIISIVGYFIFYQQMVDAHIKELSAGRKG